jgi:hypothetical protein
MDYVQCEDERNMQTRFLYGKLLQHIRLRRASDVLERANITLGNLFAIIWMWRTRSGGTVGKMHELPDFFFQRHLAEQFCNALLGLRIIKRGCSPVDLRSK